MLQLVYAAIPKAALAAGCVVLTVLLAGQTVVAHRASARSAQDRAKLAEATLAWTEASAASLARERAREQAWAADQKEITDAYTKVAAQLVADRASADAVGGRLRDSARAYAARTCRGGANPAAPGASAPAAPDFLLAELFGVVEQAGRDMATEARRRTNELAECVARYDALIKRQ